MALTPCPSPERRTDIFGDVQRRQQGAFLVARRAGAALLAGESHEHLVLAVRAADSGEALVQVAALQKGGHAALDDRPPETVLGSITLVVDLRKGGEMAVQQTPQLRRVWIARTVKGRRLGRRHDRKEGEQVTVYTLSLERLPTSCQPRTARANGKRLRPQRLRRADQSDADIRRCAKPVQETTAARPWRIGPPL